MWPIVLGIFRSSGTYLTLPVAVVIGVIGYNFENWVSDKYTPGSDSIKKQREERLLDGERNLGSLKEHTFVPKTIFEKNLSPSLQKDNESKQSSQAGYL